MINKILVAAFAREHGVTTNIQDWSNELVKKWLLDNDYTFKDVAEFGTDDDVKDYIDKYRTEIVGNGKSFLSICPNTFEGINDNSSQSSDDTQTRNYIITAI
jgi:hypothetical protein